MPSHLNPDDPRFSAAAVCSAAGIPYDTLKNWTAKASPIIAMDKPYEERPGRGSVVKYSFRRALHIALTAELGRLGIPLRRAACVALNFTDMGDVDPLVGPFRGVGELYASGLTYLLHFSDTEVGIVVNSLDENAIHAAAHLCGLNWGHAFVVVPVNIIFARVSRTLDLEAE
ncbi:hypothetical protein [Acetobacter indonesiensis]|uniref:hypothetical protein n=1 Tax=Acetobacter indonesiensis TaxID=104101 RepID=UPI0020A50701|nr:hypothetical protein [Acetobacter indonesiensis]MCP1229873.1 hypothetical protein [Acetobacter indonesiensis]